MLILGFAGKMGSGKDFLAKFVFEYIKKYYPQLNIYFLSFADALKIQTIEKYHLDFEQVYPPENIPKTEQVRKYLQFEGKLYRERDSKYWIRCYENWSRLFERNGCDILITTDVRFKEEMDYIQIRGGLVYKVYAPSRQYQTNDKSLMKDISECDLDDLENDAYDYIFKNDELIHNLEDVENKFDKFFENFMGILHLINQV